MNDSNTNIISFEKIKYDLSSDSKNVRRNCLDKLTSIIRSEDCAFESCKEVDILKLIIKSIADEVEACRLRAVNLTSLWIDSGLLLNGDILLCLLSVIHRRLVAAEEREPSEEVRLSCVKLLKRVILQQKSSITPYLKEFTECLVYSVSDQCPDVKKESCDCIIELAKTVPEFRLHSEDIINAMLKGLKHKHYKIRVSIINSLCYVVQFGCAGSIKLVYGPLGECLLDQHPQVRAAVLKTAAFWLVNLRDRYSYFCHLLPLVLTVLADEIQEVRDEAFKLWNEVGVAYLKENEENLKEKSDFLPAELEHYPPDVRRPNLGCRTLVQNEMSKIIPTLLKELEDWTVEVRMKSSELLKAIALHAEVNIISFLDRLILSMCKACSDEETTVVQNVIRTAEIIGYFVSPEIYWPLIIPRIEENQACGSYIILSSLLKNSRKNDVCDKMNDIITDLVSSDVCETREERSQKYLLQAASKLLDCCDGIELNDGVITNLYSVLVSVMAFGNTEMKMNAIVQIEKLSEVAGHSSVSDLNKNCLPIMFSRINQNCDMWESYSANFNIFLVLLTQYTGDVLEFVPSELINILEVVLKVNSDREMIFKTLHTIAGLFETEISTIQKHIDMIHKIIIGPVKQQLVWKAGRVAEVIRATALSIVMLCLQNSKSISSDFVSQIVPLLLSLCEDNYEETRLYGLQSLPFVGKHQSENVAVLEVFPKLLDVASDRLDDKSNKVRLTAAEVLKDLFLDGPDLHTYRNGPDFQKISKTLRLILINMDEDDTKIREASLDIIREPEIVAKFRSFLSEDELNVFIKNCHNQDVSVLMKKYLHI